MKNTIKIIISAIIIGALGYLINQSISMQEHLIVLTERANKLTQQENEQEERRQARKTKRQAKEKAKAKEEVDLIKSVKLIKTGSGFAEVGYTLMPRIALKWKNISGELIKEDIKVEAVFINTDKHEEMARASTYLNRSWESPMSINNIKQFYLTSTRGWSIASVKNHNVEVEIYVNKMLLKKIKIDKRVVEDWFL